MYAARPGRSGGNTAVVLGKLYSHDADNAAQSGLRATFRSRHGAVALRSTAPAASSIYGTLFQRLIVFDDLVLSDQDPYGWVLAPIDKGKAGATLADWLALPWGGPEVVILPGFHTAAEDGMKRSRRGLPGSEVFLSVCGLMANGARTLLLSRWRTGGQTSYDLVREFVQELPNGSASDAWQRAVLLTMDSRVNFGGEPRVKRPRRRNAQGSHPFFWAGYMLVDSGAAEEKSDEPPGGPVIKIKPPKASGKSRCKSQASGRADLEKKDKPNEKAEVRKQNQLPQFSRVPKSKAKSASTV